MENIENKGEIVVYQSKNGKVELGVKLEDNDVWLSQLQMAKLYNKNVKTINEHLQTLYKDKEIDEKSVIRNFRITAADGKTYETKHYNLDAVISVGYKVSSKEGVLFRIWARGVTKAHITKGFTYTPDFRKEIDERFYHLSDRVEHLNKIWRMTLGDTIPKAQLVDYLKDLSKDVSEVKEYLGLDKKSKMKLLPDQKSAKKSDLDV